MFPPTLSDTLLKLHDGKFDVLSKFVDETIRNALSSN